MGAVLYPPHSGAGLHSPGGLGYRVKDIVAVPEEGFPLLDVAVILLECPLLL